MKTLDIKAIQAMETCMLKEIDRICQREDIPYYLNCGSTLGAIRHGGPIPWDDDVDLVVPYNRYLQMRRVMEKNIKGIFTYNYCSAKSGYPLLFVRIGIKGVNLDSVHIDIFPLVGLPATRPEQEKFSKYSDRLNKMYAWKKFNKIHTNCSFAKVIAKKIAVFGIHASLAFQSSKSIIERFESHCAEFPYESSEYVMNACGHYGFKNIMPKTYFGEPTYVPYADTKLPIQEQYDVYLHQYYGEYMQYPPKSETEALFKVTVDVDDAVLAEIKDIVGL